ncbi:hypothetical protein BDZ89DRAFT_151220 [Hymenopellis radicata]|nr:hypothetical protein BDZ89DRAFT_151220 [Hymenopellis radicata]
MKANRYLRLRLPTAYWTVCASTRIATRRLVTFTLWSKPSCHSRNEATSVLRGKLKIGTLSERHFWYHLVRPPPPLQGLIYFDRFFSREITMCDKSHRT